MDIKMVDVMIHIDEEMDDDKRQAVMDSIWQLDGIIGVIFHAEKPHLLIIEYNPDKSSSSQFIEKVRENGLHGELVGL